MSISSSKEFEDLIIRTESYFEHDDYAPMIYVNFKRNGNTFYIDGYADEVKKMFDFINNEIELAMKRKYIP